MEVEIFQNSGLGIKLSDFVIILHRNAKAYIITGTSPRAPIKIHLPFKFHWKCIVWNFFFKLGQINQRFKARYSSYPYHAGLEIKTRFDKNEKTFFAIFRYTPKSPRPLSNLNLVLSALSNLNLVFLTPTPMYAPSFTSNC